MVASPILYNGPDVSPNHRGPHRGPTLARIASENPPSTALPKMDSIDDNDPIVPGRHRVPTLAQTHHQNTYRSDLLQCGCQLLPTSIRTVETRQSRGDSIGDVVVCVAYEFARVEGGV